MFFKNLKPSINEHLTKSTAKYMESIFSKTNCLQVNSYTGKPGKDFPNQRVIGMRVFQRVGRELFLACRHNVMELIVRAAFEKTIGVSTGSDVLIFKRFEKKWQFVDRDNFQPASTNPSVMNLVE